MFFFFDYFPYIAVIGDIKNSKHSENRRALQLQLKKVLDSVNSIYEKELASKFMITLGDEFQGLLNAGSAVVFIIDKIEREMYPVKLRFGIGVGEMTTDIDFNMPLGADGPAYYNARAMIDELKASEKKKMESKVNAKISIQDNADTSELINTIFSLLTIIKETWTPRRIEIINTYLACGGTQDKAAQILSINQSNVQKALASANFYTYHKALESVSKVLSRIKENKDV
ncbi:MAG: SatD family protein [Syntrophomonadaceae bacterium]|nr:SatD family protein [Syntrophomonadaceae bacterium]